MEQFKNSVFEINTKKHTEKDMFFDESVDIQRFDIVKYKKFETLTEKQKSFFWTPDEIDVIKDAIDFKQLPEHEKHAFTSNLKRQILLDSVQGRGPNLVLLPIVSLPELENFIETWAFFEGAIHSRSYTHIIRNIYPDPSVVFDEMLEIKEITDCAEDISKYYDDLEKYASLYRLYGYGKHEVNGVVYDVNEYDLKKKLWLCINSINILEGIRFYVSFATSWAFAENKLMVGNAKIIKLICRDENLHLQATQDMLRFLKKDEPIYREIAKECEAEVIQMFVDAMHQEEDWAEYLFKDGSMIGLNAQILKDYVRWITFNRMRAIGLTAPFDAPIDNPIPWTVSWIQGSDVQVAPQETEITSYVVGGINNDMSMDKFNDITL